jgi:hypothetical protein
MFAIPWGSEFVLGMPGENSDRCPAVATLPDGRLLVSWHGDKGGRVDIRALLHEPDGGTVGDTFIVNPTTSFQTDPAVAALTHGRFVITWVDWSGTDQGSRTLRAQIFGADGARVGGELLVYSNADEAQNDRAVTALADGRFVIAWTETSPGEPDTVRAQVFNRDGTRCGDEFRVETAPGTRPAKVEKPVLQDAGNILGKSFVTTLIGAAGNDRLERYCIGGAGLRRAA